MAKATASKAHRRTASTARPAAVPSCEPPTATPLATEAQHTAALLATELALNAHNAAAVANSTSQHLASLGLCWGTRQTDYELRPRRKASQPSAAACVTAAAAADPEPADAAQGKAAEVLPHAAAQAAEGVGRLEDTSLQQRKQQPASAAGGALVTATQGRRLRKRTQDTQQQQEQQEQLLPPQPQRASKRSRFAAVVAADAEASSSTSASPVSASNGAAASGGSSSSSSSSGRGAGGGGAAGGHAERKLLMLLRCLGPTISSTSSSTRRSSRLQPGLQQGQQQPQQRAECLPQPGDTAAAAAGLQQGAEPATGLLAGGLHTPLLQAVCTADTGSSAVLSKSAVSREQLTKRRRLQPPRGVLAMLAGGGAGGGSGDAPAAPAAAGSESSEPESASGGGQSSRLHNNEAGLCSSQQPPQQQQQQQQQSSLTQSQKQQQQQQPCVQVPCNEPGIVAAIMAKAAPVPAAVETAEASNSAGAGASKVPVLETSSRCLPLHWARSAAAVCKTPGHSQGLQQVLLRRERLADARTAATAAGIDAWPHGHVPFAQPAALLPGYNKLSAEAQAGRSAAVSGGSSLQPVGAGAAGGGGGSKPPAARAVSSSSSSASGSGSSRAQRSSRLLLGQEHAAALRAAPVQRRNKAVLQQVALQRSGVHGFGLFAAQRIAAGQRIVEYTGQLIRPVLEDVLERRYEAQGQLSTYLFRIDDDWVTDATVSGGLARYINHSCDPNCVTRSFTKKGVNGASPTTTVNCVGIYAKRDIQPGEELSYNYYFEFEEASDRRVHCYCGAATCRGWMN